MLPPKVKMISFVIAVLVGWQLACVQGTPKLVLTHWPSHLQQFQFQSRFHPHSKLTVAVCYAQVETVDIFENLSGFISSLRTLLRNWLSRDKMKSLGLIFDKLSEPAGTALKNTLRMGVWASTWAIVVLAAAGRAARCSFWALIHEH